MRGEYRYLIARDNPLLLPFDAMESLILHRLWQASSVSESGLIAIVSNWAGSNPESAQARIQNLRAWGMIDKTDEDIYLSQKGYVFILGHEANR